MLLMPPVISFLLLSCLVLIGLSAEGFNKYEDDVDQQEQAQGEEEELSLEQQWLPIINQGTVQWRFSIIGSLVLNLFFYRLWQVITGLAIRFTTFQLKIKCL